MLGVILATTRHREPGRSSVAAEPTTEKDPWINRWWRPLAAVVYLVICICDFILFPWYFGTRIPSVTDVALAIKDLEPSVGSVLAAPRAQWEPLTLMGGGMFHVAFGAILGVAAWTRGNEKIEKLRRDAYYDGSRGYDSYGSEYRNDYGYSRRDSYYGRDRYDRYGSQDHYNPGPTPSQQTEASEEPVDNPDL